MNDTIQESVDAALRELRGVDVPTAERLRADALAVVVTWRWLPSGVSPPGVGDPESEQRAGTRYPWRDTPPPGESAPWEYGLDAAGTVRVARWPDAPVVHIYEHTPETTRRLVVTNSGNASGLELIRRSAGRYVDAVFVDDQSWSHRRFTYDGDRPSTIVTTGERYDGMPIAGVTEVTETFTYSRLGRFKGVKRSDTNPAREVNVTYASPRDLLRARGATEAQAAEILAALSSRLNDKAALRWLADPEHAHPIPDPSTETLWGTPMVWTAINAVAAGKADLVVEEARRFANQQRG